MRAVPSDIESSVLFDTLADGWGFVVEEADYAAVGAGSYHWVARDLDGTRRFVTVDHLDRKKWLGDTRDSAFEALRRAFDTAAALRNAGLEFVVAPIATSHRETLRRIGSRHTVALFPFVDGQAGVYGHYDAGARAGVLSMLAELHLATSAVGPVARSVGLDLPGRRHLEAGLQDLDQDGRAARSPSRRDKYLPVAPPTCPHSSRWQTVSPPM